jgi:hypothetical protein
MTQSSRPQADNNATAAYVDAGPYSRNEWAERMRAAHTGDANTDSSRTRIRGIVPTYDNQLVVGVTGGPAVPVSVGTGAGMVYGSYLFNDALVSFNPPAAAANSHIDLVCMVENNTNAGVSTDSNGNTWTFPTVVADYAAGPAVPPYSARLVIISGTDTPGAAYPANAPPLDQLSTLYCVPIAAYEIDNLSAITNYLDLREFLDIEQIVSVATGDDDTIEEALVVGTQVTNGTGDDDLGVAIRAKLENDNGDLEDAGQLAIRWTDSANGSEDARYELRLAAGNADNLSAVINAPTAASADGNARGVGAVDLQQIRSGVAQVASGIGAFVEGGENTASGDYSHAEGYQTQATGDYAHSEGSLTAANADYAHAEGGGTTASATGAHAEGVQTVASDTYAHAEGFMSTASGSSSHAEGTSTTASGDYSHSEGSGSAASADYAHAEGYSTIAGGVASHAEGYDTTANGDYSHAGGRLSTDNNLDGVFIWADSTNAAFTADNADQFKVRANGGAAFVITSTTAALPVITLDQADTDEPYIKVIGDAAAANLTRDLVDEGDQASEQREGWFKIEVLDDGNQITDGDYYVPFYSLSA